MTQTKPSKHLIALLLKSLDVRYGTFRYDPRYVLFLGAGASKQSGVPLASEMVAEFRTIYANIYPTPLTQNDWYSKETLYSDLFERLFDEPSVRREHIENQVRFARPSWGYFYLVNLIEQNLFNTILTTNFDDLLNDACHSFSEDLRPIVCAHDSTTRSIRITSPRPKIIKLHGDFLYDNIKNTVPELASLEGNMRTKFEQYSSEYGLIVIGYAGNDQSVMDVIEDRLRARAFPHGIYWCIRRGDRTSHRLKNLQRYSNVHLVEIDGFDEFMAELHNSFHITHPMIDDPYRIYGARMLNMLNNISTSSVHSVIQRDADVLSKNMEAPEKQVSFPKPLIFNASAAWKAGNAAKARKLLRQQFDHPGTFWRGIWKAFELGIEIEMENPDAKFRATLLEVLRTPPFEQTDQILTNLALRLIKRGMLGLAKKLLERCQRRGDAFEINMGQLEVRLGTLPTGRRQTLRGIARDGATINRFGALIVLKQGKKAVDVLEEKCDRGFVDGNSVETILDWPVVNLLNDTQKKRLASLVPA